MSEYINKADILGFIQKMERSRFLKNKSILTDVVLSTTECIKKFVSTMQPADVQPVRWILRSERLPEEKINLNTQDYDWVLCSTTFGDVRAYHFGRGRFLHGCGDVTQYVIAWMPLPEPYQGKRKGADE